MRAQRRQAPSRACLSLRFRDVSRLRARGCEVCRSGAGSKTVSYGSTVMRARSVARRSSGSVSAYPERLGQYSAERQESALRCFDTKYAQGAVAGRAKSLNAGFVPYVISASSLTVSANSTSCYRPKSAARSSQPTSTGRPSASTRRLARRTPAFVGNMAYPASASVKATVMEKTSICPNECLEPGQTARFSKKSLTAPQTTTKAEPSFSMLPRTREELAACIKLATAGAALWFGVPAVLSILHLGGVW